ncbi:MAG: hypothetical protein ACJAZ8_000014 [Planctomycetota bacterium]|jgi:hypothetical protein
MTNQDSNPAAELKDALTAIAVLTKEERKPSRYDARMLLLPLGSLILEGESSGLSVTLELILKAVQPQNEAWATAVADELGLAGDEFCLSINPDYLKHPRYDFAYAAASRQQLEQRIQAAEHLGFPLSEVLRGRIQAADEAFDPYLDKLDE